MNYYEHHLGDYAKDTGHLSMLEHGAYRILLDRYYSTEAGIPEGQVYRLARARTDDEKAAVDVVLEEFFSLVDGIWINRRAEEELERFASAQAETEARTENERDRVRRHREDRSRMFADLRNVNVIPDWNIKTKELRALHAKHYNGSQPLPVTAPETLQVNFNNVSDTAYQTPDTRHQSVVVDTPLTPQSGLEPEPDLVAATRRGEVSCRLRKLGVNVTTADPHLCGWVDANVTDAELDEAVALAREHKPEPDRVPSGYLAKIIDGLVRGRNVTPIRPATGPPQRRRAAGGYKSVEQLNREAAVRAKAMLFGDKKDYIEGEVIRD